MVQFSILECSGVQVQFSDVHYSSGIVLCCEGRRSIGVVEQRGVRLRDGMVQFSLVQFSLVQHSTGLVMFSKVSSWFGFAKLSSA